MSKAQELNGRGHIMYSLSFTEDEDFFYILMPYMDSGNLTSLINKGDIKNELEALEYFRQICYGLDILHKNKIIHRDLETDNILAQKNNDKLYPFLYLLSISNFEISKEDISIHASNYNAVSFARAPEMTTGIYDYKADVYSLGCILYKMITKCEPFIGKNEQEVFSKKAVPTLELNRVSYVSDLCLKLLEGCLQYDKENRISMDKINDLISFRTIYTDYKCLRSIQTVDMKNRTHHNKESKAQAFNIKYKLAMVNNIIVLFANLRNFLS